jgi:MFS family permease
MINRPTRWLLNVGHAIDHMFLLIFATAVTRIAAEFGVQRWEDLMPYNVAAFLFFGIASLPAGRLGDQWGRRPMMLVFFFGMGLAALLVSITNSPLQMALALALLGCFAAIYHPVGIPMLVQGATRPGLTIGFNGLAGNMGVALAAVTTGLLVKYFGWRVAFALPGLFSLACGVLFALYAPRESAAPAKKQGTQAAAAQPGVSMARLFLVMTVAATSGGLLFNFSTNSNYELLSDRLRAILQDPGMIGLLLAAVYAVASFTQLAIGYLLDRMPLKTLYAGVIGAQCVLLALAAAADGWVFYGLQLLFMAAIFGSIPFTDALIVRFVDDSMRSRVSGMRLTVSLGASSLAVWLIGPVVKQAGFTALLAVMAATAVITLLVVSQLPATPAPRRAAAQPLPQGRGA